MESWVVIAVSAVGGLLALVPALFEFSRRRRFAHDVVKNAALAFTETAPYWVQEIQEIVSFDETGSGTVEKRIIGLTTNVPIQNPSIPYYFVLAAPGGQLDPPVATPLSGSQLPVSFRPVRPDMPSEGHLVLLGLLGPSSKPQSVSVVQRFQHGFLVTEREVLAAYAQDHWRMEYCSILVSHPVKLLRLEVHFPPSHHRLRASPVAVAFIGNGEAVDLLETERIRDQLTLDNRVARLSVSAPTLGIRYAISWMPPDIPDPLTTDGNREGART